MQPYGKKKKAKHVYQGARGGKKLHGGICSICHPADRVRVSKKAIRQIKGDESC